MIPVFSNPEMTRVDFFRCVLEDAGISTFIRNEHSHGAMGMIREQFPQVLCVVNESDLENATALIAETRDRVPVETPDWRCPGCAETVPGNFDSCWKCGKDQARTADG